jgi:tetratricopeptide (TPR) repeat protein
VAEEATFGNNRARAILDLAATMVEGEILAHSGKLDEAFETLRTAVKLEDALKYDEPPGWMIPSRHVLGAALVRAGRFADAEQVYREDLKRLPGNGWALYGLAQSLRAQGKGGDEIKAVDDRFAKVWEKADINISSSCLCLPGAK